MFFIIGLFFYIFALFKKYHHVKIKKSYYHTSINCLVPKFIRTKTSWKFILRERIKGNFEKKIMILLEYEFLTTIDVSYEN